MTEVEREVDTVNALADRFWEGILELSPSTATFYGDERFDDRLEDPGPEGRERLRRLYEETRDAAAGIAPALLPTEESVTLDLLRVVCDLGLEQLDQRVDRLRVVDQGDGPQTLLPQLAVFQRTDTAERFDRFLARLEAYPAFIAANVELVREGLTSGLTAARIVTERVIAQIERLLATPPEASPIAAAAVPGDADRERLIETIRRVVRPADAAFLEALQGPYLAASRTEPGLWSAPNGEAIYRTQIRTWTTLDLEPAEVHRIGLEPLDRIEAERLAIAQKAGFAGTAAARAAFTADPAATPASVEEYLDRTRQLIERALAASPRYFGRLPRATVEVRPVEAYKEADAPFAYYAPPAADGSRPGIYYVNTYDLASRSYMRLASTSFHEAVPGHHFQISLEMELPGLNRFRRLGSRMAGTAFTEGWGLYSERLADEMALYRSPAERFGMLDGQAWRAARLVVDTGLHALRWSRERAVETLLDAGLSPTDAAIEADRYIAWPGQALTYMIGQREIERLRDGLAERLGPAFRLADFHDALLGHGTLPLATLRRNLAGWLGLEPDPAGAG